MRTRLRREPFKKVYWSSATENLQEPAKFTEQIKQLSEWPEYARKYTNCQFVECCRRAELYSNGQETIPILMCSPGVWVSFLLIGFGKLFQLSIPRQFLRVAEGSS